MRDSLQKLIEIQKVDIQLMDIEELKGDLPTEVEILDAEMTKLNTEMVELREELEELGKEKRHLEGTVVDARTALKKYQDQLILVSSNRAYDALMTEIDTVKQTIETDELRNLEVDEKIEIQSKKLTTDETDLAEKTTLLAVRQETLKTTIAESEDEAAKLEKKRKVLVPELDDRYYETYERLRANRDGVAVVELTRGSCGSCFFEVPQQVQVNIRAMDTIITCHACGVILYPEESQ